MSIWMKKCICDSSNFFLQISFRTTGCDIYNPSISGGSIWKFICILQFSNNFKVKPSWIYSNVRYFDFWISLIEIMSSMFSPFFRLNVSQSLHQYRMNQYLGLNQQLFDLGVPVKDLSSQKIVDVSSYVN